MDFIFIFLIDIKLIFVYIVKNGLVFHVAIQLFQEQIKKTFLAELMAISMAYLYYLFVYASLLSLTSSVDSVSLFAFVYLNFSSLQMFIFFFISFDTLNILILKFLFDNFNILGQKDSIFKTTREKRQTTYVGIKLSVSFNRCPGKHRNCIWGEGLCTKFSQRSWNIAIILIKVSDIRYPQDLNSNATTSSLLRPRTNYSQF